MSKKRTANKSNTKQSKLIQEYRKERRRIQNYISKQRKLGWQIPDILPSIPKKITEASVRRLKKITSKEIQKKYIEYIDPTTGEILTVAEGKIRVKEVAKELKKKPSTPSTPSGTPTGTPTLPTQPPKYPKVKTYDLVRMKIETLPHTRILEHQYYDMDTRKDILLQILDDQYQLDPQGYTQWLLDKEDLINVHLDIVHFDSKLYRVEESFVTLAVLLNKMGKLGRLQAETLSEYSDFYYNYNEDEEDED